MPGLLSPEDEEEELDVFKAWFRQHYQRDFNGWEPDEAKMLTAWLARAATTYQ